MSKPIRIQRKRTKDWKISPNGLPVVYVGRPTKWGNRWSVEQYWAAGYSGSLSVAQKHCVEAFSAWMHGKAHWAHSAPPESTPDVSVLRGKNLACWCPPEAACHADVLLEIANADLPEGL